MVDEETNKLPSRMGVCHHIQMGKATGITWVKTKSIEFRVYRERPIISNNCPRPKKIKYSVFPPLKSG